MNAKLKSFQTRGKRCSYNCHKYGWTWTDIKLGDGVEELGGLAVIGTERHESRRIDDQLRGRSGRQGDRGDSRFTYLYKMN